MCRQHRQYESGKKLTLSGNARQIEKLTKERENYQTRYVVLIMTVILLHRGINPTTGQFHMLDKLCRIQYNPKSHRKIILI